MFNHNTDPMQTYGGNKLDLEAVISGGSSPAVVETNIPGLAVSRPDTGKYRFTFDTDHMPGNPDTANIQVTIHDTTWVDATWNVDASALADDGVLDVWTGLAGVAANLASTALIHIRLCFKDTGVASP